MKYRISPVWPPVCVFVWILLLNFTVSAWAFTAKDASTMSGSFNNAQTEFAGSLDGSTKVLAALKVN